MWIDNFQLHQHNNPMKIHFIWMRLICFNVFSVKSLCLCFNCSHMDLINSLTRGPCSNQWIYLRKVMIDSIYKIGPIIQKEKIFKFCECILAVLLLSPIVKRRGLPIWTNLNPLHPGILFAKFGWNWFYRRRFLNFCYLVIISPWSPDQ